MVTDKQVRRFFMLMQTETTMAVAALKAGMDVKTARKYRRLGKLPGEVHPSHAWRTRADPFAEVWDEAREQLKLNTGLEAKSLFEWLQRKYPGRFADGQIRSFQRRVKRWRALEGPPREVFFAQVHEPGRLCQSDFTHMTALDITIDGQPFAHLLYHFVLTYSNWETCTICFSESFESLRDGLQNALWELGGVPAEHQTDRLSSAVCNVPREEREASWPFTQRYRSVLSHYGLQPRTIQAGKANENGDVEQRHHRFKRAVEQALLLRGSRDFADRAEYAAFLAALLAQLNAGRRERLAEEWKVLRGLPPRRLEGYTRLRAAVDSGSLIHVDRNVYSVNSRLIGEEVEVRLHAEHLDVWYGQKHVERIPRLCGRGKHHIVYRHIIDWLVRKPGAFENYRYREELFPTSRFRMAYDALKQAGDSGSAKAYLRILELAAKETEFGVDQALRHLLDEGQPLSVEAVEALVRNGQQVIPPATAITVAPVNLADYDTLLAEREVA